MCRNALRNQPRIPRNRLLMRASRRARGPVHTSINEMRAGEHPTVAPYGKWPRGLSRRRGRGVVSKCSHAAVLARRESPQRRLPVQTRPQLKRLRRHARQAHPSKASRVSLSSMPIAPPGFLPPIGSVPCSREGRIGCDDQDARKIANEHENIVHGSMRIGY